MLVMAISICEILCVPLVTSIGFKWERLFLYIPRVYLGWPDCLIGWCVLIHFFPEKTICSQQLIHLFFNLVDFFCTFPQNVSHIAMDCYQLQLGHELLVDQLNRHLLKPNTGCESQDHLGLGNFSQVFEILKIATLNSPFPRPWAVETWTSSGLCSRAPCSPPRSTFGTDFCSSQTGQTGETFKHKSFF